MTLLIVLGALACVGLVLTAVCEHVERRLRPTTGCAPGCRCRGTAPRL